MHWVKGNFYFAYFAYRKGRCLLSICRLVVFAVTLPGAAGRLPSPWPVKGVGHLGHEEAMEAGGRQLDSRMSF